MPFILFAGTVVHLLLHVLAVVAEGGRITDLSPSLFGETSYWFSAIQFRGSVEHEAVAFAPTVGWLFSATFTATVGMVLLRPEPFSRLAFLAGYLLPILDLSGSAGGLFLRARESDWFLAFHDHELMIAPIFAFGAALYGELGWQVFKRLWPDQLSSSEYTALYLLVMVVPWLRHLV